MKIKTLLAAMLFAASSLTAAAVPQGLHDIYRKETFVDAAGTVLPYRMLRPEAVNAGEKYPLVVFLHGSGERGNDNEAQLIHGASVFSNPVNMERFPAFVIFPQCPEGDRWVSYDKGTSFNDESPAPEESANEKALLSLISQLAEQNPIDTDRIYLVGLSMGGIGTYDLVCRYPELFAAAVPICGAVNPTRLPAAKDVKFRIFHGDSDETVNTMWSRKAYKALRDAGADVEYIEFPGTTHNSWTPAFSRPDFLPWLFAQKKK